MTLASSEATFQLVVEWSPTAIVMVNRDGKILLLNSQAEQIFGYRRDELIGEAIELLVPDAVQDAHVGFRDAYVDAPEARMMGSGRELYARRKDGSSVAVEIGLNPITTGDGLFVVSSIVDITERKKAEQRALQAERLAAIGQMVAGLVHESRNALQRTQACLEMLELEIESNAEALALVKRAEQAQADLQRLFEEVRGYAAPMSLDRDQCRLSELCREAWSLVEPHRRGRTIELVQVDLPDELPCSVDRFRIVQVFRNILENSLAAVADPGTITIQLSAGRLASRPAVRVALHDSGPGFNDSERNFIFEPFYTTKPKGTGLGMAIAKRIIDAHDGTIEVGSATSGAEIVIMLPA